VEQRGAQGVLELQLWGCPHYWTLLPVLNNNLSPPSLRLMLQPAFLARQAMIGHICCAGGPGSAVASTAALLNDVACNSQITDHIGILPVTLGGTDAALQ